MTSLISTDSSAILSSLPHDMVQVLAGVRYIMGTSIAQDSKLMDIIALLATQADQIRERDQSIMIMQSKIDCQQAIIEEIQSEQRSLIATVASLSQSRAQDGRDGSATLPPSDIHEMPEPVARATTIETSGIPLTISVPKPSTFQPTPKLVSSAPSETDEKSRATTSIPDDTWMIPDYYARTQRGGGLQRHGAFYGTPDWHAMATASGSVPNPHTPPSSPPPSRMTSEDALALKMALANENKKLEARERKCAAAFLTKPAASDDEDRASGVSSHSSSKRYREPDEPEETPNPMSFSDVVHDGPDRGSSPLPSPSSSGHCPVLDDGSACGPAKRRRLSVNEDGVESPTAHEKKRPNRGSPRRELD